MAHDDIPEDIKSFIGKYIRSIGHLEALLFLIQDPSKEWDADSLSRHLRTNHAYATSQLAELSEKGLLIKKGPGKFTCCAPESQAYKTIHKLQELYKTRPSTIIKLVYESPNENLSVFIDAFNMKKKKD